MVGNEELEEEKLPHEGREQKWQLIRRMIRRAWLRKKKKKRREMASEVARFQRRKVTVSGMNSFSFFWRRFDLGIPRSTLSSPAVGTTAIIRRKMPKRKRQQSPGKIQMEDICCSHDCPRFSS